jgi:hypothetical protein
MLPKVTNVYYIFSKLVIHCHADEYIGIQMKKGMIFRPAHGDTAFTVPLFDEFMKCAMLQMPTKGGKA